MANPLTGAMQAVGSGARAAADSIMSMKNIMTPFNSLKKDIQSIAKSSRQTSANISKLTKVMLNANKRSFMEIEEARERFKEESKRWDTLFDYLEKIVKGMTGLGKPDKGSSLLDLLKNALKGLGNWLLAGASALAGYLLKKIKDWWKGEKKEAAKEREREKAKEKQEREREKQKEQREREKDRKGRSAQSEEELKRKAEESRRAAEEARRNAENARTEAEKARQAAEEARTEAAREQAKAEESRSRRVADEFDKRAETAKAEADALEREAAERQQKAADTQNEAAEKQNKAADKNTETKGAETKGPETKPGSETKVGPEAKPGPEAKTETKGAEAKPAEGPIPEAKSGPEVTTEAFNVEAEKKNVEKMKRQLKALEGQAQGKAGTPEGDAFKQKADEFRQKISESEAKIAQAESGTKPKAEAPKAEAPKAEAPRTESAKPSEAPRAETPRSETPTAETRKAETPRTESARNAERGTARGTGKSGKVSQFARGVGGFAVGTGIFTAMGGLDRWLQGEDLGKEDWAEIAGGMAAGGIVIEGGLAALTAAGVPTSLAGPAMLVMAGMWGKELFDEWLLNAQYEQGLTEASRNSKFALNEYMVSNNPKDREKALAVMGYIHDYASAKRDGAKAGYGKYQIADTIEEKQSLYSKGIYPLPSLSEYIGKTLGSDITDKGKASVNRINYSNFVTESAKELLADNVETLLPLAPTVTEEFFSAGFAGGKLNEKLIELVKQKVEDIEENNPEKIIYTKEKLQEDILRIVQRTDSTELTQIDKALSVPTTDTKFATGGIVTAETKATIGEAGAEAVLPLQGRYARDSASLIGQGLLMPLIEWGKNNIGMDLYNASANTTPSPIVVMADNKKISTTNVTGGRGGGGSRPEFNSGPTVVGFEQLFANMIAHYAKGAKV